LFLPFSQVDSSDTRPYGGIGLGLFICKSLVELMGGTIGFESKKGRGSVFWFVVPFKRVTAASVASACDLATPETTALASVLHDKLVLVVEDNPTLQSMVIKQLASLGAQVQAVSNGRKAIDAIANRSYDLVFMDCHLPGMSGFEATRKIREMECAHQLRIPIVAMTAGAMKGDREKCIAAGMDEYLSKPFTMQQLHQKLEEVLFVHSHKRQQPENVYDGQQSA
jgi:CheY-like chemotaxis protein